MTIHSRAGLTARLGGRLSAFAFAFAAVAVAVAVLAGCGAASDPTGSVAIAPAGDPSAATPAPSATADCGNPVQSFAPPGRLPRPGAMPAGSYMAQIARRGRLIAGVSSDTLLFGARNPITGTIEGFDIDMLHAVAKAVLGDENKIEFRVITYARRLPSLQDHSVDVVAHTMTINCKRWAQIDFSAEYFHAGQKVLVRVDSPATGITGLDGKRVCAAKGSTNIDNLAAYPKVVVVGVDDLTDCLVKFQQGDVDAITADDTVLAGFAAQDPYAKVVGKAFTDEPYGLGVAKDHPEFVSFVNAVLDQVKRDGRWTASYQRWMGAVAPGGTAPVSVYGRTR